MVRGGSRWSVAIGALVGLLFLLPRVAHASTPVSLTLVASPSSAFIEQPVTLTLTTSPVVAGLPITFSDTDSSFAYNGLVTDESGSAVITVTGTTYGFSIGEHHFVGTSPGDGTYGPATSNTADLEIVQHPTSITLSYGTVLNPWNTDQVYTTDSLVLHARVTAVACEGDMAVYQLIDGLEGGPVREGTAHPIQDRDGGTGCGFDANFGEEPVGTFQFLAVLAGDPTNAFAQSSTIDIPVTLIPTQTHLDVAPNPIEAGLPTQLMAGVFETPGLPINQTVGTVTFFDGTTQIGAVPIASNQYQATLSASFASVGVHDVTAVWSGSTATYPSTSSVAAVTVLPNSVDATGLGVSSSTFYPVVDGYGDTVNIVGSLGESASVAISITNSKGEQVRSFKVPALGAASSYSVAWDGHGGGPGTTQAAMWGQPTFALVPAGVYHVTQVVTDDLGARFTVTTPVTLSDKTLHWYTSSKTLYGNQFTARGGTTGSITSTSSYYRGERITILGGPPSGFAALGYQFTLPSAVEYSSLSFSVLGSGTHGVYIGMQNHYLGNWPAGSGWVVDYFSPLATVSRSYGWTRLIGDPTANRIGHTVRGLVLATGWSGAYYNVAEVKLTYRYALLK